MEIENREITNTGKRGNPVWVKGGPSPNPAGRPKRQAELTTACRDITSEVIMVFTKILLDEGEKASDRLAAGTKLLEYGWGRPRQGVDIDVRQKVDEMTDEERRARIKELLEKQALDVKYEVE